MITLKTTIYMLAATCMIFVFGCNDNTSSNVSKESDTTSVEPLSNLTPRPNYDQAMDSYEKGGKAIKKLGDSLGVKMYEFTINPGESWALHTHPDHTVYTLEGGTMALFMKESGRIDTLTFPTGMALISGPLTDSGRNVGKTTIKMLVSDIYRPREK